MTREEFATIVTKINQVYLDKKPITKEGFDIWYDLLSDLEAATLDAASSNYIRENRYPPTIADLRSEYQKIKDYLADVKSQLRAIYDRTRGIYPDTHLNDDEETRRAASEDAMKAWWDLVKEYPIDERIARAERIESVTNQFVRKVEEDENRKEIPTLADFFRGAR